MKRFSNKTFLILAFLSFFIISCGKSKGNVYLTNKYYSILDSNGIACTECLVVQIEKSVITLQFNPVFPQINHCIGQASYQAPNGEQYELPTAVDSVEDFELIPLSLPPTNNPADCLPASYEILKIKKINNHTGGDYLIQFMYTGTSYIIKSY